MAGSRESRQVPIGSKRRLGWNVSLSIPRFLDEGWNREAGGHSRALDVVRSQGALKLALHTQHSHGRVQPEMAGCSMPGSLPPSTTA